MKRLLTFLLPFFLIASALAEEWRSDEHLCAITLPSSEPWQMGNATRVPAGEMIFSAANMESKQVVSVIVIPDFPTTNVNSQASVARFGEIVTALGFEIKSRTPMEWLGRSFIEITGLRAKDASGEQVLVARATIFQKKAYLVTTFGRGEESRIKDERFMRVIQTFRFMELDEKQQAAPSPFMRYYRTGYIVCLIVMLVLIAAFAIMYFRTMRRR